MMQWQVFLLLQAVAIVKGALQFVPAGESKPGSSSSMICHTSNTAECYPAIFQATDKFQVVHEDQMIPRGLHVRMNLETGINEARLDVPGDEAREESGLDVAVPVVESDIHQASSEDTTSAGSRSIDQGFKPLVNALLQDSSKGTRPSSQEKSEFTNMLEQIVLTTPTTDAEAYLSCVENLTDMVHDVELGLTISEDRIFIERTWYLLTESTRSSDVPPQISSAIALLWGTALQNNAPALEAFLKQFPQILPDIATVIIYRQMVDLEPKLRGKGARDEDVVRATRQLFLVSQLCQDNGQYDAFFEAGGLSLISRISSHLDNRVAGRSLKLHRKLKSKIQNFRDDHHDQAAAKDIPNFQNNDSRPQLEL